VSTVDEAIRDLLQRKADELELGRAEIPVAVRRRARRRVLATLTGTLVLVAALAAGGYVGVNQLALGTSHHTVPASPRPSHPVRPSIVPTVHPSSSPSPSLSPSPSPSPTPATLLACTGQQLRLSDGTQGAAGSVEGSLLLTNASSVGCTVSGQPQVALIASGSQLSVTVQPTDPWWKVDNTGQPAGWPVVTVEPGKAAVVRVRWANWCGDASTQSPDWAVTPLGFTAPLQVQAQLVPPCNGPGQPSTLEVGPLEPNPSA
jgi:hypothetical protein